MAKKTPLLTPEQIANFPVEHFSPSSIRKYLEDPQGFFYSYVRANWDTSSGPSMLEGTTGHAILKEYYGHQMAGAFPEGWTVKECIERHIDEQFAPDKIEKVEWGKTGSEDKSKETVRSMIGMYFDELPELGKIIAVEEKLLSEFEDLDGVEMPVPIKCVIDLLHEEGEDLVIRDHKFVAARGEEKKRIYEFLAASYFFTVRKHYGRNPARMVFDEVKKSKNKDGTAQRVPIIVDYTPEVLERFLETYRRIVKQLAGIPLIDAETGILQFLPNPFGQYTEESWLDFCEEVDTGRKLTMADIREAKARRYKTAEEVESPF